MYPSNTTLAEFVKYYASSASKEDMLEFLTKIADADDAAALEIASLNRQLDRVNDQNYHRGEVIEIILGECIKQRGSTSAKVKELTKFINLTVENSYVEL